MWVDERFRGEVQQREIDGEVIDCVVVTGDTRPLVRGLCDFPVPATEANVSTVAEEAELFELINFGGVPKTDTDRERAA